MGLGVDLRTDTKMTSVYKRLGYMLNSRLNSQDDWQNLYDHIMSMKMFNLTLNKMFMSSINYE